MRKAAAGILLAAAAFAGWADDGSWSIDRAYDPSEGALYAEAGNPDIVLQREFLELDEVATGSTTAVFQFHNTARGAVTVQAGFPLDGPPGLIFSHSMLQIEHRITYCSVILIKWRSIYKASAP